MLKHGICHGLDIVRSDKIAPLARTQGPAGKQEGLGRTRPGPYQYTPVFTRPSDYLNNIFDNFLPDMDLVQTLPQPCQGLHCQHRLYRTACEYGLRGILAQGPPSQRQFLIFFRRVHPDLEHEPVFLGFRKWVCAFVFNRVLRCKNSKVRVQIMCRPVDRDHPFLHGLKQRGLGLGRRPVNLVRQQKRGKNRPLDQGKPAILQIKDMRARNIRRHQVRGELNPRKFASQDMGERPDKQGLGNAGHALDKGMIACKNCNERFLDHALLADDDLGDFLLCTYKDLL